MGVYATRCKCGVHLNWKSSSPTVSQCQDCEALKQAYESGKRGEEFINPRTSRSPGKAQFVGSAEKRRKPRLKWACGECESEITADTPTEPCANCGYEWFKCYGEYKARQEPPCKSN